MLPLACFAPAYKGRSVSYKSIRAGHWEIKDPMGKYLWGQLDVAHDWHRWPSELGICQPDDDVALMAGFTRTKKLMQVYEDQEREKQAKIEQAKIKAKGKK